MLLQELPLAGLLFSPFILFVLVSFVLTLVTHSLIYRLALSRWIWRDAWFDVSLFVCYLALTVWILGR